MSEAIKTMKSQSKSKKQSASVHSTTSEKHLKNGANTLLTIKRDNIVRVSPPGRNAPEHSGNAHKVV